MPMLQTPLTIQRLYDDNRESLQLGWFAGFPGGERLISGDVASAADQVGHLNTIHPGRIQVFGHQEINYYQRLKAGNAARHPGRVRRKKYPIVLHPAAGRASDRFSARVPVEKAGAAHHHARRVHGRAGRGRADHRRLGPRQERTGAGTDFALARPGGRRCGGIFAHRPQYDRRPLPGAAAEPAGSARPGPARHQGHFWRDGRAAQDAPQADRTPGQARRAGRGSGAPAVPVPHRRRAGTADPQGRHSRGRRPQHRGAAGSGSAQYHPAIARDRHPARVHGTATAGNEWRLNVAKESRQAWRNRYAGAEPCSANSLLHQLRCPERAGRHRLLLRRQPAPGPAAAPGLDPGRGRPAVAGGGGRRAQRRVAGHAAHRRGPPARGRPRRARDVPHCQYPLAGGAVFRDPAQPSAVARTASRPEPGRAPHPDRVHPGRARTAVGHRAAGPRGRHVRTERQQAARMGQGPGGNRARTAHAVLRIVCLQARRADGRRFRVRRAGAAQSLLRPDAAPADGTRRARDRVPRRATERGRDAGRYPRLRGKMAAVVQDR
uniref:HPr(Ser) kinase/phosphorylase N-terminal domain-containing protein n=1 Tax=Tanacetum cinerariifolium TaxID=118510 RepID=A0A699GF74_TANCI|nr:hypothetical protein [Tanacetum cinerariifolium]